MAEGARRVAAFGVRFVLEMAGGKLGWPGAISHSKANTPMWNSPAAPLIRSRALVMLGGNAPEGVVELLRETIRYARTQKAGLELEAYLYTTLAEALIALGSASARETAIEARDLARRRAMRLAEAEADRLLALLDGHPDETGHGAGSREPDTA
ncbi:MAG: hypothetical protein KGJ00_10205 [Bradyrhizobium sp.]|nr:hypothetical protein [Bradyrhizobium sp.]